jgi:hypothetical protein
VQPIKLFDAAMIAVLAASYPLPPKSRSAFLADVAVALARLPEIGPGAVHRVIVETQRKYFDPPILSITANASMMPALKIERCEQFYTDTDARSAQTYSYGALPVISPRPKSAEDPSRL